jgi:hypothetical protein
VIFFYLAIQLIPPIELPDDANPKSIVVMSVILKLTIDPTLTCEITTLGMYVSGGNAGSKK